MRYFLCRFYSDSETWAVHKQFMWGAHLLITPVLDPVSQHTHTHTHTHRNYSQRFTFSTLLLQPYSKMDSINYFPKNSTNNTLWKCERTMPIY